MTSKTQHQKNIEELDYQIRSRRPIIYICTHEEDRILTVLQELANRKELGRKWRIHAWDIASGVQELTVDGEIPTPQEMDQEDVLKWFSGFGEVNKKETNILVLKDYQKFLGINGSDQIETVIVRQLRNMCSRFATENKTIIIIGTSLFVPEDIEKNTFVIDWSLPEYVHIQALLDNAITKATTAQIAKKFKLEYTEKEKEKIVRAFQGLTTNEIELLIKYMFLTASEFDTSIIASKKKDIIRKSEFLEWEDAETGFGDVGGLEGLKDWLNKRSDTFSRDAKEFGLPEFPKGVLLLGIQGCGKSLTAKAIANQWQIPLLKFDVGKIFSSHVGESESNIRKAIKIAESISPCVMWVDELDKGFSGMSSSDKSDGGTTARVFATFYTWMNDKKHPVYLVATANEISHLPPELLRKGRFDEIFWVDLPDEKEREAIFKIHLGKRNRDVKDFDLKRLVEASKNYSGAEIESSIQDALYEAYGDNKRALTNEDIIESLQSTVPLFKLMQERITKLRNWAGPRTRSAANAKHKMLNPTTMDTTESLVDSIETLENTSVDNIGEIEFLDRTLEL